MRTMKLLIATIFLTGVSFLIGCAAHNLKHDVANMLPGEDIGDLCAKNDRWRDFGSQEACEDRARHMQYRLQQAKSRGDRPWGQRLSQFADEVRTMPKAKSAGEFMLENQRNNPTTRCTTVPGWRGESTTTCTQN
jgi:hypothetical protein